MKIFLYLVPLMFIGSLVYLVFSSPSNLVISTNGEIDGILNKTRETIQGKVFWKKQLSVLESDLEYEKKLPEKMQKINKDLDKFNKKFDDDTEKLYLNYPSLRPSPKSQAELLREAADNIEQAESDAILEKSRLEEIQRLEIIKKIIIGKLQRI